MSEPYDAQFYAASHHGNEGDIEFYATLCEGAQSVLELGCGSGRVLSAVVPPLATGLGVDLHEGLLALARDRTRDPHHTPPISYQRGDMRTLDLGRRFDRVLIPYSGLFCLGEPAGLRACLAVAAAHLAPDGLFAVDAYAACARGVADDLARSLAADDAWARSRVERRAAEARELVEACWATDAG